jgi:HPt (histidine-containing phosphotransfer) domain-containing protein
MEVGHADSVTLFDEDTRARLVVELGADRIATAYRLFDDEMQHRFDELATAAAQIDLQSIARIMHAIQGSASAFGASAVAQGAKAGGLACRNGNELLALHAAHRVSDLLQRTLRSIRERTATARPKSK